MSFKGSKVSSLAAALAESHPLAVFEPDKLDTLRDPTFIHDRVSDYFSSAGVVLKQSLDTFELLSKLTQLQVRDKWAESKIKEYQSQGKHSDIRSKDAESILRESLVNPLPLVTDSEVDAFIKALMPAQLRTLKRMHTIKNLDGFEYMWDLEEKYDASICEEKSNTNTYSIHDTAVVLPSVIHKPMSQKTDERAFPRVSISPVDPLFTNFKASNSSIIEDMANTHTSNTTLAEPACTVEVEYAIGADAVDSASDDESTGSFCRFSRMAIARAEKRGLFQVNLELSDLSKGKAHVSVSPKDRLDASILIEKPQCDGMSLLRCNKIFSLLPSSVDAENNGTGVVAQSNGALPMEDGLNPPSFSLTTARISHATSGFYKESAQNTHSSSVGDNRSDNDLLREHVRNILLLSKVRERDELKLRRTIYKEAQQEIYASISKCIPAMEQLLVLLKEVNAILPAFNSLERSALSDYIEDPSNFLLIPRHTLRCAAFTCGSTFSTTVMRVRCGRCGQVFCPQCCRELGLGPDVCCGDQRVSLGWEPICDSCWCVCQAQQAKNEQKNLRRLHITTGEHGDKSQVLSAMFSSNSREVGDPAFFSLDTGSSAQFSARNTTNGFAGRSSAEFSMHERLEDGFAMFHVVNGLDNHVSLGDSWRYRMAKMRGSLQCLWQRTGILARKVVTNTTQQLKQQRRPHIKKTMLPMFYRKEDASTVSLPIEERVDNGHSQTP